MKPILKYRVGQARDARMLAELLDVANYGAFSDYFSQQVTKKGETWVDVVSRIVMSRQSEYHFNDTFVAIVERQLAGAMFTMVNPDPFIVNGLDEMRDDVRNAYKMRMQLPGAFWLRDLAVFPQYRNFLRIGMRLIQFSIEQGFERGFQQIGGMVHDTNEKLLRYYQSIGAKVIDRIDVGTHPTYAPDSQWNLLVLTRENWKNTI